MEEIGIIATELTPQQEELFVKLHELRNSVGSMKKACQIIGPPVYDTAVSSIKKGNFAGNLDNFFAKLEEYFAVKEVAKASYQEIEYANISFSERACDIMRLCHAKGGLAIICGDAGIGKTKAIQKYVAEHPTNTIYITVNECFARTKPLLAMLAEAMGLIPARTADGNWIQIAGKLTDGTLIIIDESQNFTQKTVDTLRSFSDHFKNQKKAVGICLVGNFDTVHKFGKRSSALPQIKSRTQYEGVFQTTRTERSDIIKLFPFLREGENDAEIDFLLHVARSEQGIRGTVNLVSNAYDNDNVSYAGLVAMAKEMDIQI